jgi:multidrug efflux system outer membrane protein
MMKRLLASLIAISFFNGCFSVGPDYRQPELPEVDFSDLLSKKGDGIDAQEENLLSKELLAEWWSGLKDPELTALIEKALVSNPDIKETQAKILETRAQLGISRSSFFPTIDANASYAEEKQSKNVSTFGDLVGIEYENDYYLSSFDANWEIDIFGGTRRKVEAAIADMQSQEASLQAVQVSLSAEVALNYVQLRTYQQRLNVAEENQASQAKTLDILTSRFESGLTDELAVSQARYNLEKTRSSIPALVSVIESYKNNIAVLTGELPGTLASRLSASGEIPVPGLELVSEIPTDTLRQRPDVRMAERGLAAQSARIGEAESDLYPKFFLAGSFGYQSLKSSNLYSSGSEAYSYGPAVSWPLLHFGAIRNNIRAQTAVEKQYLAKYEKAVLNAVKEIRNALMDFVQEQKRYKALSIAVEAAETAEALASSKYKSGLTDFNNVLDAQRSKLALQEELVVSEGEITANLIRLYKALGGGWQKATKPEAH